MSKMQCRISVMLLHRRWFGVSSTSCSRWEGTANRKEVIKCCYHSLEGTLGRNIFSHRTYGKTLIGRTRYPSRNAILSFPEVIREPHMVPTNSW